MALRSNKGIKLAGRGDNVKILLDMLVVRAIMRTICD